MNDIDLVELAGFHAYRLIVESRFITVNGKKCDVMHVIGDSETGLDAITVQNTITKDYTAVYEGTDPKIYRTLRQT